VTTLPEGSGPVARADGLLPGETTRPLTLARMSAIVRRQGWLALACVILALAGAEAYAHSKPAQYSASAVVTIAGPGETSSSNGTYTPPAGPDPASEVSAPQVESAAARAAHLAPGSVTLSVVPNDTYTEVAVTAGAPSGAAAVAAANAAARVFVTDRRAALRREASSLDPQLGYLRSQISTLSRIPGAVSSGGGTTTSGLAAQLSVLTTQYQDLYGQQLLMILTAQTLRVSDPASGAVGDASSLNGHLLEIALGAGLLIGVGVGLAREQVDDRIRPGYGVSELAPYPLLAELPRRRSIARGALLGTGTDLGFEEPVRSLRTALQLVGVGRQRRVVLVCSPGHAEGASTVAANLAVSWASAGLSTVLVGADLRRPSPLPSTLTAGGERGLSDVLLAAHGAAAPAGAMSDGAMSDGSMSDDVASDGAASHRVVSDGVGSGGPPIAGLTSNVLDAVAATSVPGLSVLGTGGAGPPAAELYGSPALAQVLRALREHFAVVVLDGPPVLDSSDARLLADAADATVLVVAERRGRVRQAREALQLLAGTSTTVLGVVVDHVGRALPWRSARRRQRAAGRNRRGGPSGAQHQARPRVGAEA